VTAGQYVIIVDNLDGTRAYPVDSWHIDVRCVRLTPVVDHGKTTHDFSSFTSFRLVTPDMPETPWLWDCAQRLITHPEPTGLTSATL
jgi:hypothetical protein